MQCGEFEERVQNLLDERRSPESDEQLLSHAVECAPCRRFLAGQEVLIEALDLYELPAISPDFSERTLQRARMAGFAVPRRSLSSRFWWGLGVVVAASLLLALSPMLLKSYRNGLAPRLALVVKPTEPVQPAVAAAPPIAPEAAPVLPEASAADANLLATGAIKPEAVIRELGKIADNPPLWMNDMAGGFRPVTNSLGEAIQVLRQAIPGKTDENRPHKPSAESTTPSPATIVA